MRSLHLWIRAGRSSMAVHVARPAISAPQASAGFLTPSQAATSQIVNSFPVDPRSLAGRLAWIRAPPTGKVAAR